MTTEAVKTDVVDIEEAKLTLVVKPDDPITVFGDREIKFMFPGKIRGISVGGGPLETARYYVESASDPGAIGAGALWLDTSGGATIETGAVLYRRTLADSGWIAWNSDHDPDITTTAELNALVSQPGSLDVWAAQQYGPLFDWAGRGQIKGEFHVLRDHIAELVGDEIVQNVAYVPTASPDQSPVSQRGTQARRCMILRRTEHPDGPTFLLLDRGPADADDPTVPVPPEIQSLPYPATRSSSWPSPYSQSSPFSP